MDTEMRLTADVMSAVADILERELGERWGDGMTVVDVCAGYAEPGYGASPAGDPHAPIVVFGNWNDRRWASEGGAPISDVETLPSRLFDMLETAGATCEWHDEWTTCEDCHRAMRTQPDSYVWRMFGAWVDTAGYICADCLRSDLERSLADYINDASRAVTWADPRTLEAAGWEQWAPNDPQTFESGWHPGQDDDPATILATILEASPDTSVVFLVNDVGQFDLRFSAWTAPEGWGE